MCRQGSRWSRRWPLAVAALSLDERLELAALVAASQMLVRTYEDELVSH